MDILSFALYHENTEISETPMAISKGDTRPAVSDDSDSEEDDKNVSKRLRLDKDTKVSSELQARIWDELTKSSGGHELTLDDICDDVEDRAMVRSVVDAMAEDGKLMVVDRVIYQT